MLKDSDLIEDGEDEGEGIMIEEEDNESEIISAASSFAETEIRACLKRIIKECDRYRILPADLVILSKMYMVLTDLCNHTVDGYFYFIVKSPVSSEEMDFYEVHIDGEGLRLTTGILYVEDECEEHDIEVVFPFEDEYLALNSFEDISNFVNGIKSSLLDEGRKIDAFDSGDAIEYIGSEGY